MRVVSVDLGWRHLAACTMHVNTPGPNSSGVQILSWDIIDLLDASHGDVNINTTSLETLVERTSRGITAAVERWCTWPGSADADARDQRPDVVFLESQPLGAHAFNVKTKTLSHIIQAALLGLGVRVAFVSPRLKLKPLAPPLLAPPPSAAATAVDGDAPGSGEPATYRENKAQAVENARALLASDTRLAEWDAWYARRRGKRDDLADALLQGVHAARGELEASARLAARAGGTAGGASSRPKAKRARRTAHAIATGSVCAGLDAAAPVGLDAAAPAAGLDVAVSAAGLDAAAPSDLDASML